MEEKKGTHDLRKHIRFNPDSLSVAILGDSLENFSDYDSDTALFTGQQVALIENESWNGCSLILMNRGNRADFFPVNHRAYVKIGKLPPAQAVVKWREIISPEIIKIGMEILSFV